MRQDQIVVRGIQDRGTHQEGHPHSFVPIDKEAVFKKFRIQEKINKNSELWDLAKSQYSKEDEPCDCFLTKIRDYGLSHHSAEMMFNFLFNECKEKSPESFCELELLIDIARTIDIPAKEFESFLEDVWTAVTEERKNGIAEGKDPRPYEMARRFGGLTKYCVNTLAKYDGPGKTKLSSILKYQLMDLKMLPGQSSAEIKETARKEVAAFVPAPFVMPSLDPEATEFKVIRPPRDGEDPRVTRVRILLDWIEGHGGDGLRDCLYRAMLSGQITLGQQSEDVFLTPFHNISSAIKEKFGRKIPYFIDALCLNIGLSAFEEIAKFDSYVDEHGKTPDMVPQETESAESFQSQRHWDFLIWGLESAINEACRVPRSFAAEIEYVKSILPWALAGKIHPVYAKEISSIFFGLGSNHRYEDFQGEKALEAIGVAKLYLEKLLEDESTISHDSVWDAFSGIKDPDLRTELLADFTSCMVAGTYDEFLSHWRKILTLIHPGVNKSKEDIVGFAQAFYEWSAARKDGLKALETS